jgi:ribonucleoside-diphosphate reductase alpha chain
LELNDGAKKVFQLKYAKNKSKSWKEIVSRIAKLISSGEKNYNTPEEKVNEYEQEFHNMIFELQFIPGGRIIANSGTGIKNLANCISGNTKVYTLEHGLIPMNRVEVGDSVITHENRLRKVSKIWSNGIKEVQGYHKGRDNSNKYSIVATPDHKILTEFGWKPIQEAERSLSTVPPKLISEEPFPESFSYTYDSNVYENIEGYIKKLNKHVGKMGGSGIVGKYDLRFNSIKETFFNDPAAAYFFGLFLSEGSVNGSRVYFTFHEKEQHLVDFIEEFSRSHFGFGSFFQKSFVGKWVQVSIYSELLAEFMNKTFGKYCFGKRIPQWVFNSKLVYAEKLLQGILDGDGIVLKSGTTKLVLANPTLVYETVLLARYCGFDSVNFVYDNKNKLSKRDTSSMIISTSSGLDNVYKVGKENYEEVFDMEVEEDHSFVAGDIICHNCFVLGIEDSRTSIYKTLGQAAEVFAAGGGLGYNFSHIREEGAPIVTTGGKASGPVSFMTLFDQTGEVIQQASRRGAQIAIMSVTHADIEKFVDFKSTPNDRNKRLLEEYHKNLKGINGTLVGTKYYKILEKTLLDDQLTHFNVSVAITDEFMEAVEKDLDWELKSIVNDAVVKVVKAKDLLMKIAKHAWISGDPGTLFTGRINIDNIVPYIGTIEAVNP